MVVSRSLSIESTEFKSICTSKCELASASGANSMSAREFVENPFEFRAGLHADEFQAALVRVGRIAGRGTGGGSTRPQTVAAASKAIDAARRPHHDRFSDLALSNLTNGSMRNSTSSLFQK